MSDAARLADELLDGSPQSTLERCGADQALTALVCCAAVDALVARAIAHRRALAPAEAAWPAAQEGLLRLASLPGADAPRLAHALFDACVLEATSGPGDDLRAQTMRWLLAQIPERVARLVDGLEDPEIDARFVAAVPPWALALQREQGQRFILTALFGLRGQEGADWLLRLLARHDFEVGSMFQAMCAGQLPEWTSEDWVTRLEALAEPRIEPPPRLLGAFVMAKPPPASAVAQVRVACVYGDAHTDELVRTVAENVGRYRSDDVSADAALFWWGAAADERATAMLRWILELSGPRGSRERLVAAAAAAGWIDAQDQDRLASPLERPAWADREVPWEPAEIVAAGAVRLPDGRLAGGDPWWSFEGVPFELQLAPGSYAARAVVAAHPFHGRENAAAELIVDEAAGVSQWELVETTGKRGEGYVIEVGVASFGATRTLCPGLGDSLPAEIFGDQPASMEVDGGDAGSLVMFTVGPQHQECRTWAGFTADGRIARVLTDLGLLDLDPTTRPLPWDGGNS